MLKVTLLESLLCCALFSSETIFPVLTQNMVCLGLYTIVTVFTVWIVGALFVSAFIVMHHANAYLSDP